MELSETLLPAVEGGQVITIVPKGGPPLQTLPDVFNTPVGYHAAVLAPDGSVLDPLVGAWFGSVESWTSSVVEPGAGFHVLVNGVILR